MKLETFADAHRLKISRDECGDRVIVGKVGQIYEHGDVLGVLFMPDPKNTHPQRSHARKWSAVRDACVAVGMKLVQQGDAEGCLTFMPSNKAQVRQAIKAARIRTWRQASPAQLAVLAARHALTFH